MEDQPVEGDPLGAHRVELRALCYRMLGSFHDAEDALQEISVRAWRSRSDFAGRSSLRTWLYRIAVNTCLNELARKERRVLPIDLEPSTPPGAAPRTSVEGVMWLEPFPSDPLEQVEDQESVELAFVAAIQHLPGNQRAALLMFDVFGFTITEIADMLDTTTASVNSALQRARKRLAGLPTRSQRESLAALGEAGQRELVRRYTSALRRRDLNGLLELLTEDATWSMPPIPSWYRGHSAISSFLLDGPFAQRWRHRPIRVNGQLGVADYMWNESAAAFLGFSVDVLDVRGDKIASIVSFLGPEHFEALGLPREFS